MTGWDINHPVEYWHGIVGSVEVDVFVMSSCALSFATSATDDHIHTQCHVMNYLRVALFSIFLLNLPCDFMNHELTT